MDPTFSEFSYGYALTEELACGVLGQMVGAPIFPSLYGEGQPGGGYDVKLPIQGAPLFLQFKLSHYLKRSTASEWDYFGCPYFRMYLRPLRHSQQHNLLLDLERRANEVYYATPRFHTAEELNDAYIGGSVLYNSGFCRPMDIGRLSDKEQHYIVFERYGAKAYLFSTKPKEVHSFYSGETFIENVVSRTSEKTRLVDEKFFDSIAHEIINGLLDRTKQWEERKRLQALRAELESKRTRETKARFVGYLTRAYFDAELFVVGEPPITSG